MIISIVVETHNALKQTNQKQNKTHPFTSIIPLQVIKYLALTICERIKKRQ